LNVIPLDSSRSRRRLQRNPGQIEHFEISPFRDWALSRNWSLQRSDKESRRNCQLKVERSILKIAAAIQGAADDVLAGGMLGQLIVDPF